MKNTIQKLNSKWMIVNFAMLNLDYNKETGENTIVNKKEFKKKKKEEGNVE